jgi:hypothetical protein
MKDWETFVETLTPKIMAFDATIPELPPRDTIFRIYRDVRFSRDQTPYKVELFLPVLLPVQLSYHTNTDSFVYLSPIFLRRSLGRGGGDRMLATISTLARSHRMSAAVFGLRSPPPFSYCDRASTRDRRTGIAC